MVARAGLALLVALAAPLAACGGDDGGGTESKSKASDVDFFPSRADARRAEGRIASSLAGPSTVRTGNGVVHYTDDPGTPKRTQAEGVVNDCLR
jgi:hypothetical protein